MLVRWVGAVLAAVLVAACGPAPAATDANALTIRLTDNKIVLDKPSVAAGTVTVNVSNVGAIGHSVDLIRTDVPHDRLPPDPNDQTRVQETDVVKKIGLIAPGKGTSFTLALERGTYVLLCNEAAHYLIGMHVPLQVR